jgi:hypothetical protein
LELEVVSRTIFCLLAITKLQAWILKIELVWRIIIFAPRHVQGSKHITWNGWRWVKRKKIGFGLLLSASKVRGQEKLFFLFSHVWSSKHQTLSLKEGHEQQKTCFWAPILGIES